jgi:hypothetical protein
MEDLEKKHYIWLKEKYDFLVEVILGSDYYTNSIHVFDADVESFNDMKKKIDTVKYDLKMWRRIAIVMTIISVMLVIFK